MKVRQYIGFYGCENADRIVAVRPPASLRRSGDKPHHLWTWRIKCPVCKKTHVRKPMWRLCSAAEQRERAEVTLSERAIEQKSTPGKFVV